MANLLQSSQNVATTAPSFYTNYLSNLAQAGQTAQQGAQYVGAQPLQTQAFQQAACGFGTGQQAITSGQQYLGQAAGQNIAGAASPYLAAGTSASPLCALSPYANSAMGSSGLSAASPYLGAAATNNPAAMAQQYMNPFISAAVQNMSDIAQRNIQQNLAPQAVAATVGSGQFGSQRGAQALGQIEANAEQCLNANIANMMSQGYGQALCAAGKQQALLGNIGQTAGTLQQGANQIAAGLGSTAATAQQAQNQAQLQAGQTAEQATAAQAAALQQAGTGMGALGTQASQARLACLNALATLGGQQQTIGQNQQLFPLTTLSSLASLLQGYQIPTSVKTTMCQSPLSAVGTILSGTAGMFTPAAGQTKAPICYLTSGLGAAYCKIIKPILSGCNNSTPSGTGSTGCAATVGASGGSVANGYIGCASTKSRGALPRSE